MNVRFFGCYTCLISDENQTIEIRQRRGAQPLSDGYVEKIRDWMLDELQEHIKNGYEILDRTLVS